MAREGDLRYVTISVYGTMMKGEPIDVFNNGDMARGTTFVDDIVTGVVRVLDKPATPDEEFNAMMPDPTTSNAPYRVFNDSNGNSTLLMDYIAALGRHLMLSQEKFLLLLVMCLQHLQHK